MGDTLDARVAFLQRQLHAISLAAAQAKARNDQAAIVTLRALWEKVRADVLTLQAEAHDADAPAALLVTLDALGDEVIKTGRELGSAGVAAISGIGATLKYLPVIVLVALVVVGLIYAGKIRKGLK